MEFGLRDWLLILGPLFIAAVLVHGYWRMRQSSNPLKMSLDKDFLSSLKDVEPTDDLSLLRAELPNGGARVVSSPRQAELILDEAALSLDEKVPVLMEPVQLGEQAKNIDPDAIEEAPRKADEDARASRSKLPERLFVINVLSNKNGFHGQALLEVMVTQGLKYGAMKVFHRYGSREDRPLFSLVNAVEPGTFDLEYMENLLTPGVSLFMQAHELADPAGALDEMISVAESIALELDGRLTDERHSDMTPQTLEHNRQIARDYSVKSALA